MSSWTLTLNHFHYTMHVLYSSNNGLVHLNLDVVATSNDYKHAKPKFPKLLFFKAYLYFSKLAWLCQGLPTYPYPAEFWLEVELLLLFQWMKWDWLNGSIGAKINTWFDFTTSSQSSQNFLLKISDPPPLHGHFPERCRGQGCSRECWH